MSSPLVVLERAVELHSALDAAGFPHALGGALALGYHVAEARGTRDIDVNVTIEPDQAAQLFSVLPTGILWSDAEITRVQQDGQVRLLWPLEGDPVPIPVDVFLVQHEFHLVIAGRVELVPMLDALVPILSATDLTVFKVLFDRRKDWGDIEELVRFGSVDAGEVASWLTRIVGPDDDRVQRFAELVAEVSSSADEEPMTADLFGRGKRRLGD